MTAFGGHAAIAIERAELYKKLERALIERQLSDESLSRANAKVRALEELVPTCAWCHRIRGPDDSWQRFEDFLSAKMNVKTTHAICPKCWETQFKGADLPQA